MDASSDESLAPVIRAALDQTRSAACITTAELDFPGPEIVYVNPAYCRMTGRRADEVLGETPRIMQGPLTSRDVLQRLRSDLEAGRPFVGETVNYRLDGDPYFISWRIDPVVNASGVTTHYIATQDDITRLRRAERLLRAEQSIDSSVSELLTKAGETSANLETLATDVRDAVGGLNDYGTVTVSGSIRLGTSTAVFNTGAGAALPAEALAEAEEGASEQTGETDRTSFRGEHDGRFWIGCSMSSEGAGIEGAIVVGDLSEAEADFVDRGSLERAAQCARRAFESLAEYERQRQVAVELQRSLLPPRIPALPGFELCARYRPGAFATRVGGDWYDVVIKENRTVMMVGDVAGSGVRAAADMGRLKLMARVLLEQGAAAEDVFTTLNHFCADEDVVATTIAVTIDTAAHTISVVSAGHPPPIVERSGSAEIVTATPGPLFGIGGETPYPATRLAIRPDDTWFIFTDGLFEEATETIDVSLDKLAARVARATGDLEGRCDELIAERLGERPPDDITMLAFRITGPSEL